MKKLISKYPLTTFLLLLALLFAVIFVGKKMRSQEAEEVAKKEVVKTVEIFDTSKKLQVPITGEVDRADTIILRATANGIVTRTLKAGDKVYRGKEIMKLSDTYSGSSQAGAAAAIAQRNAQFQNETSDTQRDILKAQKKDLNRTKDRQARIAWKQHFIQERSVELAHDTAQLQASQAYATVALFRTVAPLPGQLEEVTVKVGDYVQAGKVLAVLKTNDTNSTRITAHIGAERAAHIDVESQITAQYKNKTIPLEIIHLSQSSTGGQAYTLTFRVSKDEVENIDDGSFIEINLPLMSSSANYSLQGVENSVLGDDEKNETMLEHHQDLRNKSKAKFSRTSEEWLVEEDIESEENVLVPLDSVHFSTNSAEVYVSKDNNKNTTAELKTITIGEVIGSYIIVTSGLEKNSKIIMNRNVTNGEKITISN